jgi:hypothetical protein
MVSAAKFIRGLEGNMRLRVNNKTIPDYARGFKNPVPKPPNGGNGYIIPLVKFIAKGFKFAPLIVLFDLLLPEPVADGTVPPWAKDINEQQSIIKTSYPLTRDTFYRFVYRSPTVSDGVLTWGNDYTRVNADKFNGIQSWRLKVIHKSQAFYPADNKFFTYVLLANGKYDSAPINDRTADYYVEVVSQGISTTIYLGGSSGLWGQKFVAVDGVLPPPVVEEVKTSSDNSFANKQAGTDTIPADKFGKGKKQKLPGNKDRKIINLPEFFKAPKISPKPIVEPNQFPYPVPDYLPDPEPEPEKEPKKLPIPKTIPEPKINPDPQPDINPKPDKTPKPEKKWTKITKYIPEPKEPIIINSKPPIVLDKTPKPLPDPQPVKPPPPIQTPIDKCVDHCGGGGGGTIDFNLPDDSELAGLLRAIKKKVDEIEQSVNQTLEGEIEIGSCEIPKDKNNQTDELVYEPDPAKKIIYKDKGLKAINLALSGVQTKLTSLHEEFCQPKDIPSSIPEWWQVRAGSDRPQLVVIFKGGNSYWSMAIPWYRGKFKEQIINLIPGYNRGNFSTILTLNDNSKIVVNASSKDEGKRFIKRIQAVVKPKLLEQAELKAGGERKGKPLKTGRVIPVYAKYFATGQQDLLPDWRYNFKTQKFIKYAKPDT